MRLRELCSEGVEEADGVDLEEGVYSSRGSLEILEDVLGEEPDNVDQGVGGNNTVLDIVNVDE